MSSLRCSGGQADNNATERDINEANVSIPIDLNILNNIKQEGRRRSHQHPRTRKAKELVVLVGNLLQVEHWHGCAKRSSIYEILGEVASVFKKYPSRLSSVQNPLTMVLRDRTRRGTLKILFAADCPAIPNLAPGCIVRCIGKIEQRNIMRAFKINLANDNDEAHFDRIRHVCKHAASGSFL